MTTRSKAAMVPVKRTRLIPGWRANTSKRDRCLASNPRYLSGSASSRSRLAFAAAQPRGLAVKLWPCQSVKLGSLPTKASNTAPLVMVIPIGRNPAVSPLDSATRSGLTPARWLAKKSPQRPKPVRTSSAINKVSALRTRFSTS